MRPSSLRRDRQKQYNYMTQDEYEQELRKQVEEKKRSQQQEKMQNQQEILNHYKNYQLGGDDQSGEDPRYMRDLDQLVQNRERDLQRMGGLGGNIGGAHNEVFQGDMNAIVRGNQPANILGGGQGLSLGIGGAPGGIGLEKKPFDLFSDNFVQNYGQQNKNNENMNIINSIFGNAGAAPQSSHQHQAESERERRLKLREMERMKRQEGFSGGDYGQVTDVPPISQQTNQPQSYLQNNIFGEQKPTSSNQSKRDQIWQQKLQQRLGSQEGQRVPNHQPGPILQQQNVSQMLPIFQNQGQPPIHSQADNMQMMQNQFASPDANMRSSRVLVNLKDARKLDQSLNVESSKDQKAGGNMNNPLLGGDDDLIKKRRENEKKQRQQEYQDFLQKQNKGKPNQPIVQHNQNPNDVYQQQNVTITTAPTSAHSNHRPSHRSGSDASDNQSNVLLKGGLQQLGMNQQIAMDDKLRKQREYKQMLDLQNQQKQNSQMPPAAYDRKKELSDQIFAEVMSSSKQNFYQPIGVNPMGNQIPQMNQLNRGQSAITQNIQPKQDLESNNSAGGIMKYQSSEEDQKRLAMEKKKEYAMQLQQQMALKQQQQPQDNKRRRGTSQVVHQQQLVHDHGFQPPNQYQQMQKPVFEYQQPPMMQQQQMIAPMQMGGMPDPFMQMPPMSQNLYGAQDNFGGGYQPSYMQQNQLSPTGLGPSIGFMNQPLGMGMDQPQFNQYQPQQQIQQQYQPQTQLDPKDMARQKQEDYRRELEMQIRLKEEQKKQQQISQQLYDQKQDKDFAQLLQNPQNQPQRNVSNPAMNDYAQLQNNPSQMMMQGGGGAGAPPQNQNFSRQRTDVSKINNSDQDQMKALKQQQYQEELQRQMEEKKRQKEEEKRKIKMEEDELERKMLIEREILNQRQHEELVKDGKRDPNAPYMPEKKKQVRRDQFEPSQDNPNAPQRQGFQQPSTEIRQTEIAPKESLFGNDKPSSQAFGGFPSQIQPSLDLPMNNRREDLFGDRGRIGGQSLDNHSQFELPPPSYEPRSNFGGFQSQNPYGGLQDRFQPPSQSPYQNNNYGQPPSMMQNQQQMPQASVVDEQSKLIHMYQSALEQILQIKNQFYDQALQMNDKLIKEREQLIEYEKLKQQQNQEIQSLQAVYSQLGQMMNQRPISSNSNISNQFPQQNPILNPMVQNNLNNLISQQKADILRMSQSGGFNINQITKLQQQHHLPLHMNQQQYPQSVYTLPIVEEQPNILEQSLSSDTKFVNIPQNKLAQIAQQNTQGQLFQTWKQEQFSQMTPQQQQQFINQQQQQQPTMNQSMMKSLAGTSQLVSQFQSTTPQKLSASKPNMLGLHSRPQTSANLPETIVELPKEEDVQVNQSKQGLSIKDPNGKQMIKRTSQEEHDFNSRESSKKNSPERQMLSKVESKASDKNMATLQQQMITNTNPLGNTTTIQENMLQIETMLNGNGNPQALKTGGNSLLNQMQQHQQFAQAQHHNNIISPNNKTQEKFHNQTGSSFYNQTLQHQKQQEQSQMEELQKQLMRIFGNTNNSEQNQGILEQMQQKPATPLVRQQQQQQQNQSNAQQQQISYEDQELNEQQQMQLRQYQQQQYQMQQQQQYQQMMMQQQQQQHQQYPLNSSNNQFMNPLQRASYNEKLNTQTMSPGEKDLLRASNINIADSVTGTQNMQEIVNKANQKFSSNGFYANQLQFDNHNKDEIKTHVEDDINRDESDDEEVKEIAMNDKPLIQDSMKYQQSRQNLNRVEESTQQDVWNDPDLIPPPVVMINNDDDDYYYEPHINQSALGQYNQYTSSMIQDGTLKNLQMFSPPSDENNYNLGQYESQHLGETQNEHDNEDNQHYGSQFTMTQNNMNEITNQANQFNFGLGGQGGNQYQQQQQQQVMHPVFMETNDFQRNQQQNQPQFEQSQNERQINEMVSEKSVTKKEREIRNMMEVAKLIQKATDTTNTLFENSENFKFKIKREQIKQGGEPAQNKPKLLQQQNSRKNIKTNDPFKHAEAKLQNTTLNTQTQQPPRSQQSQRSRVDDNQSNINLADSHRDEEADQIQDERQAFKVFEQDKDDDILSNLDKMIFNLQAQQQKCQNLVVYPTVNPSFGVQDQALLQEGQQFQVQQDDLEGQNEQHYPEDQNQQQQQQPRSRPFSSFNRPPSNNLNKSRSKSNKKNRPISAVDDQQNPQKLGKYAQMALQNQDQVSQGSKKSLGRFAQMAIQNGINNPQIIQEVQQRYIGDEEMQQQQYAFNQQMQQQNMLNYQNVQQSILRPVSGKSNSTRYQQNFKPSSQGQRNKSGSRGNQQMFYDEESDDYTAQIAYSNQLASNEHQQQQQYDYDDQDDSGFNIAYVRNEREAEME
ncbi:UNKNOWN [Stylonychia lemnae]|uniref:Uncharacterized protein n=1 Tax=Stylonychia lemnae TaxID=5949 RepID=A0A078AXI4_STYLE|nr:UNKNOWN [Stylonychia lemnae]|eukprot:CDW85942.1 UNKNOWN [Stylonychia lemnae]